MSDRRIGRKRCCQRYGGEGVDFFKSVRWYMDTFGLLPSDVQTIGEGDPALVFMRCDRGDTPADHHTFVLVQNVINQYSHSAFECLDLDDIAMGQEHLLSKGWKHAWGVGRHLLGSQIFDYWRDPWGDKVEHFADSDMFTSEHPTDVTPLTTGGLYQWGPPVPSDFEAPKLTPAFLWKAIRNVHLGRLDNPVWRSVRHIHPSKDVGAVYPHVVRSANDDGCRFLIQVRPASVTFLRRYC